ncbi:TetR/AcrR family transcriptional regulator [Amycolatopsis rubida]|uniref:TetR/AcrR family transcriptional regulator n=1 Tax=Amycolatopsis rubida TaxID=112413 RepID=A0ABX0BNM4_9PSEU|nr:MULTISPECIES: TetR/AcrR family transcriptional regulator [Amycolatopsis]MYW89970.1 TetR family transcriptional regulator [Amycolatopsis rubida]NEC54947.1 TetR/AcrR family transcriptional regulator [Amycolatopsis rubida]OAP20259.1 HTH-type transcriptional repressor KstR2 [Amycolatopsis sp. M39]
MPSKGRAGDILATFTRYVAERGYDATNFSDIAGELGLSKGTIVHHFGTKDRLLAALHESYMRRRLAEAALIRDRLATPTRQLAGLLYAFVLYQVVDREATVAFQREVVRLADHEAMAEGRRMRAEYLDLVRATLAEGIASGEFRPCDVEVQSLLIFGSAHWAWTWFDPAGPVSAEQVGAQLVELVLGGLLTRRARLNGLTGAEGKVVQVVRQSIADTTGS